MSLPTLKGGVGERVRRDHNQGPVQEGNRLGRVFDNILDVFNRYLLIQHQIVEQNQSGTSFE